MERRRTRGLRAGELEVRPAEHLALAGGARSTSRSANSTSWRRWSAGRADRHPGRAVRAVWGGRLRAHDRSVDVYVHKLRVKLAGAVPEWRFIHTHFGFGYRFSPERSHPFHTARSPTTGSVHDQEQPTGCWRSRSSARWPSASPPAATTTRAAASGSHTARRVGGERLGQDRHRRLLDRRPRSPRRRPSCSTRRTPTSRSRSASPAPAAASRSSAPARPTSPTPRARSRTTRRSRSARRTASPTARSRSPTTASPSRPTRTSPSTA